MRLKCFAVTGLLLSALLAARAADAVVVKNLYTASVPVVDQSPAARDKALRTALSAVVVKVTGSRPAVSAPGLTDFLAHPERAMQRYRYEQVRPIVQPGQKQKTRRTRPRTMLHLWVRFDSESVNQALQSAGQPIWGRERPLTLVWLAKQNDTSRAILSADSGVPLERFLQRRAEKRGIAIALPLMDLQDQRQVRFSDIAGGFTDSIRQASARYQPNAILVGDLHTVGPRVWTARWQLLLDQDTVSWKTQPGRLATVSAAGIRGAANYYAGHFALQSNHAGAQGVAVEVSGIHSTAAYAHVLRFLKSLTLVRNLRVERVSATTVRFRLDARGKLDKLREAIGLGDILRPDKPPPTSPVAGARSPSRNGKTGKHGAVPRATTRAPIGATLKYHYTP